MPCIPSKGSVGASGDLAPLSHLTLALLGEGEVRVVACASAAALAAAGITPVVLGAKEGLALINGTQISAALALHGLFMAERVFEAAVISGAMAVDAAKGSDAPFDPRLHELRGQPARSRPRMFIANCSPAARSARRIWSTTTACRTRTVCVANHRSWARAST